MAYDMALAERIRTVTAGHDGFTEKKMFGGIGFMLRGNMCVGIWKDSLIVRLDPEQADRALQQEHVRVFDVTGRPMTGWVLVDPPGIATEQALHGFIGQAIGYVALLPAK
jgi:hypothetical protein